MMSTNRETQFAGFARALYDDIRLMFNDLHHQKYWGELDKAKKTEADIATIIARRAYDLVVHACETVNDKEGEYGERITLETMIDIIPDLPNFPHTTE